MSIQAKVICHSQEPSGGELITLEVEFHRFILAEVNTHRVLSRNYQSSRAVPVDKMLKQVRENPAIPVHWGKNQRGMVAEEESNNLICLGAAGVEFTPEEVWRFSAKSAADYAEALHKAGYHKQIVNRVLEPYVWTKGVITGTREAWESVFKLRCHKDAQPEFKALAEKIKEAIENSIPEQLGPQEWHLPYVSKDSELELNDKIKVSCSCCAQVSYRMLDDSLEKARMIYGMLNLPEINKKVEDPPHFSPAEHVAMVGGSKSTEGNFRGSGFIQYRKMLEILAF